MSKYEWNQWTIEKRPIELLGKVEKLFNLESIIYTLIGQYCHTIPIRTEKRRDLNVIVPTVLFSKIGYGFSLHVMIWFDVSFIPVFEWWHKYWYVRTYLKTNRWSNVCYVALVIHTCTSPLLAQPNQQDTPKSIFNEEIGCNTRSCVMNFYPSN